MTSTAPIASSRGPEAATRLTRTAATVLGISTLVFLTLTIEPILSELPYMNPIWQFGASVLIFGGPPLLAVVCYFLDLVWMKRVLGAYAILFFCVVATWLPAMVVHPMPAALSPWPFGVMALGTVAAALAWRPRLVWACVFTNSLAMVPIRFFASGGETGIVSVQDAFFTLTFVSIFTALAMLAIRDGYALDDVAAHAMSSAARGASVEARAREQGRLDALVHDEVMSTLYYASLDRPELQASVQRQAIRAVAQLGLVGNSSDEEPSSPEAFVARIRSIALTGDVRFSVSGRRSDPIPAAVAAAFAEATAEALRNSIAHAGDGVREVSRSATIALDLREVTVTVADDGVGFEPRNVDPHRLGIPVSIRGRLAVEEGGSATIASRVGHGVVVTMHWREL
jgi:signal transduction histidine kinase